jgi:hypothetical protein
MSLWTTSGDKELIGAIVKVSSLGFCAECECEDVAQKIGTVLAFRLHSRDINQPLKNAGCIQPSS